MQWSSYQQDIFNFAQTMPTSLIVRARAGTGKTTTIVELTKHLRGRVLFCAFNKAIANELKARLPRNCDAKTLHALGFGAVRRAFPGVDLDENKAKSIAGKLAVAYQYTHPRDDSRPLRRVVNRVVRLAGIAKGAMLTDIDALIELGIELGIIEHEDNSVDLGAMALALCTQSAADTRTIDFDDMVFFPWKLNLRDGWYDYVIVDEAQDMNAAQLWLAKAACKRNGKLIVVGDDRQAIYAWRGADSDALNRMKRELNATELPLSVTYRCPQSVVRMVQNIVPDYKAAPEAPEGEIREGNEELLLEAKPGDFVLSRKNAPLMKLCLRYLAQGVPATIQGRDIGKNLRALITKSKATTITGLENWVGAYQERECSKAREIADDDRAAARREQVVDTCNCLRALTEDCEAVSDIDRKLDRLFSDDDPMHKIVLSSVHKAKGLERDTVFVLRDTFKPGNSIEESNLWYVAVTRTKRTLAVVTGVG